MGERREYQATPELSFGMLKIEPVGFVVEKYGP